MTVCPHCNAAEGERHHIQCMTRTPGYAQDERRSPQPGYQLTKGDSFLSSGTTSRSDPRIYSPSGDTWATKFKTEVAAYQRSLELWTEQINEKTKVIDTQKDEIANLTAKLDARDRTIRALAVYRDFFELLQKIVPT